MKRVICGVVFACVLAIVPVYKTAASPLCAIYTPDDVEYFLFFCYLKDR